jgi:hypothetical protein
MKKQNKSRSLTMMRALALVGTAAVTGAIILGAAWGPLADQSDVLAQDADGNYVLTLDSALALGGKTSVTATTELGNSVTFNASDLAAKAGDLAEFSAGGTFTNDAAITGLKKIAIDFDDAGTVSPLKLIVGLKENGAIVYDESVGVKTLSADGVFTLADATSLDVSYFKIINEGTAVSDVSSITLTYGCSKSTTDYQKITYQVEGATAQTGFLPTNSAFASPYTPSLAGYTFKDWVDSTGASVTGTTVTGAMSVSATWYRNVESFVSGAVQKDFHYFPQGTETVAVSDGATFNGFANGGGSVSCPTGKTTYTINLPYINYASAVSAGGELSFDLYTNGWSTFTVGGFTLPYDNEHASGDPYHVMIKSNGLGYGVYASSTSKGDYGELGTLADGVANGTASLAITVVSDLDSRTVTFTKMSIYALDYTSVISAALTTLTTTQTAENLAAYRSAILENLTPYEKSIYVIPDAVTTAKTALAGTTGSLFAFPTPDFTDTAGVQKQIDGIHLYSDCKWAATDSDDTTSNGFFVEWKISFEEGKTSAYIEMPRLAYAAYDTVVFKSWMGGTRDKLSVNGTQIEASTDAANHDWCYYAKIVTTNGTSVLTLYHGNGSKGPLESMIQGTWTLPSDVANGQTPMHFAKTTTEAWTVETIWALSAFQGAY